MLVGLFKHTEEHDICAIAAAFRERSSAATISDVKIMLAKLEEENRFMCHGEKVYAI